MLRVWTKGLYTALIALSWQASAFGTDTLLVNGHIYTGNKAAPWADALAITGARIEAVGSRTEISKHGGGHARVIDLKGRTVIPGIVDSHLHLLFGAYALHGLNLSTAESSITPSKPDLLIERLKAYAAAHPDDLVLFGRADFSTALPTTPTHALLDRAVPDRPLVIHNTSEHALWLNSAAMRMAGLTARPLTDPDEERGVIRDASGNPSGVLLEAAMQIADRAVEARVPLGQKLKMIEAATHYLNSFGITSVVNATGDLAEIKLYATLSDRGTLTVRTRTSFGAVAVPHHLTPGFLEDLEQARRSYHDEWVSANLVKFFIDGGTGLLPPLVYTPRDYAALVMALDERGYQLMSHALRADSVHLILDTYEQMERAHGPRDRRLRIEHADLVDADDVPRFAKLAVIRRHAAHLLLRRNRDQFRSRAADSIRSLACARAKRGDARVLERLALHLAAEPVRVDAADGDPPSLALGGYGRYRERSRGWRGSRRRCPDGRDLYSGRAHPSRRCGARLHARLGVRRVRGQGGGHLGSRQARGSGGPVAGYLHGAARNSRQDPGGDDARGR